MEATFLTAIHINKVRHLKDIDIPLSSDTRKNLLLTGKNGSGKTSVLNALIAHFEYVLSSAYRREASIREMIAHYESRMKQLDDSEEGRGKKAQTKKDINGWNNDLLHWTSGATSECKSFENLREKYSDGNFIFAYFRDHRKVEVTISKNIEKVNLKPVYKLSDMPSKELAKYMVNLKTTQAFAKNEGNEKRADEIGNWFQRFEDILRTIYDEESVKLNFDIENFQFTITMDGREPFDFNTMSMGYAAVFDIIGDLIMRMESQHRYDLEGIVLIDEIETHLHVELQKKIVPILTDLFPNIQFIMTTHSPFVLNSAQNAVIYDLEKHMLVENGLTNLPYEGVVEGYFGADRMSQELRDKFERYKKLVGKPELTDEEYAETAELETYLDEVPDYLALDFAAEYNRLKLEFANRG